MRMQVILDSSFARPGSGPIWGGKKGEFRDWTKVGDEEIENTLYADDTTLFVKDLESVQELLEMLENFRRCSGLELNKSKTEAMWLGSWAGRKDKPFSFRWPEVSAYALGIHFTNDSSTSDKLNFEKKLEDLQRILNSWKRRKLTLLGKLILSSRLGCRN